MRQCDKLSEPTIAAVSLFFFGAVKQPFCAAWHSKACPFLLPVLPAAGSAYALSLTLSLTIQQSIRKTSLGRGYAALSLVLAAFGMSLCRPLSAVRCPPSVSCLFSVYVLVFRFCFASVSLCLCSNRELALHT